MFSIVKNNEGESMDKKRKKYLFFATAILLIIVVGGPILGYCMRPDGSTMESREKMLNDLPKGTNWTIATERLLDGYLITGIVSDNGKAGIAVFEPRGNGKYKLQTSYHRNQDDIIIGGVMIEEEWYDLIWFNGVQTERAEVTYTVTNEASQSTVYLSDNDTIICSPTPFKEYTLHVTYYDSEGNKYE